MSKLPDHEAVRYQLGLLQKELEVISPLLDVLALRHPDAIELRAVGSVLQTFYNGIEAVLSLLMPQLESASAQWHLKLLEHAVKMELLTQEVADVLDQYRRFRHKFRHAYGFTLKWEMMEPLVKALRPTFQTVTGELGF